MTDHTEHLDNAKAAQDPVEVRRHIFKALSALKQVVPPVRPDATDTSGGRARTMEQQADAMEGNYQQRNQRAMRQFAAAQSASGSAMMKGTPDAAADSATKDALAEWDRSLGQGYTEQDSLQKLRARAKAIRAAR